jgi:hypothetical protein
MTPITHPGRVPVTFVLRSPGDQPIQRDVSTIAIPRVGETILVEDRSYRVADVVHNWDESGTIYVYADDEGIRE